MTHAVVLIECERDVLGTLGPELAAIEGVTEAYSIAGDWDFVAIVRVARHDLLAEVFTGRLVGMPGVVRTQTLVALEVFSQHDIDAIFDVEE